MSSNIPAAATAFGFCLTNIVFWSHILKSKTFRLWAVFLQARCPSSCQINNIKALKVLLSKAKFYVQNTSVSGGSPYTTSKRRTLRILVSACGCSTSSRTWRYKTWHERQTHSEVWCLRSSRKKMHRSGWPPCGCHVCSHLKVHNIANKSR